MDMVATLVDGQGLFYQRFVTPSQVPLHMIFYKTNELQNEISNNVVCSTSKASDQLDVVLQKYVLDAVNFTTY